MAQIVSAFCHWEFFHLTPVLLWYTTAFFFFSVTLLPLLLLPSIFPSIRVFSSESVLHIRWPKYWSFSFSISPSNSGLISFRMDWLDLLAVQGTLKSLLQHHSSKHQFFGAQCYFIVQLSHPYMTTGKTIALTRWTFVGKVMSLLYNMLSKLVKAFLLRSKRLLLSWLQSPSAVILEPPKIKSLVSIVYPSICHEVMQLDAVILVFWMLSFKPTFYSPLSLSYLHSELKSINNLQNTASPPFSPLITTLYLISELSVSKSVCAMAMRPPDL